MIKPGKIQKKARTVGVRDQQIEKDYILSWILQGVAMNNELSKVIVLRMLECQNLNMMINKE